MYASENINRFDIGEKTDYTYKLCFVVVSYIPATYRYGNGYTCMSNDT